MNKVLIITLIVFLSASSLAVGLPRHLNPSEVPEELPLNVELLTIYSLIVDAVQRENFSLALKNIDELGRVYIPENLRYIYSRFNELLDREIKILNQTKISLDNAEYELFKGVLENARSELRRASSLLAEVELIDGELSESCREFSKTFRIPLLQLSEKVAMLKELIKEYRARLKNLLLELERLEGLIILDTLLTLHTNVSEVLVGSELFISGTLRTEDGSPLLGKTVTVYLDGRKVTSFITDRLGLFKGFLKIPYIYKPTISIFAEYIPDIEDRGRFRGSRSNVITLRLVYNVPTIIAWLNSSEVRPSDSFEIHGQVIGANGIVKTIYVSFLGMDFNTDVLENGNFRIVLSVPENAPTGRHKITVYTKPHGIIAPASKSLEVMIYKINTSFIIEVPSIVLGCYRLQVHGKVVAKELNEEIPVSGDVVLEVFDRVLREVVESSDFSFNISIPCYAPSGYISMKITYIPRAPIYNGETIVREVLLINPLTVFVPVSIVTYLMVVGINGLLRRVRAMQEVSFKVVTLGKPEMVLIHENVVAEIAKIYFNAVHVIEDLTGLKRRPSDTIREFLDKAGVSLGKATLAFEELSYMTEAAIYGGIEPDLELARHLYDQILRWLI
ncbi:MAG: DUF4129 domain-containing protein [Nitrososphaerota archaeon]